MDRRTIVNGFAAFTSAAGSATLCASLSPVLPPGTQLFASYAGTGLVTTGSCLWIYLWVTAGRRTKAMKARRAKLLAFVAEAEVLQRRWQKEDTDELWAETENWGECVRRYLHDHDPSDAALFDSDSGFNSVQYASQYVRPSKAMNWLQRRKFQLDRLIQQVE